MHSSLMREREREGEGVCVCDMIKKYNKICNKNI